jgi:hypothetical protein
MTGGNDGILEMCKSDELMTDEWWERRMG